MYIQKQIIEEVKIYGYYMLNFFEEYGHQFLIWNSV